MYQMLLLSHSGLKMGIYGVFVSISSVFRLNNKITAQLQSIPQTASLR